MVSSIFSSIIRASQISNNRSTISSKFVTIPAPTNPFYQWTTKYLSIRTKTSRKPINSIKRMKSMMK